MATTDDDGNGACFVAPTMLEFKLLEQSAETATGTFSGYLAAYGNTDGFVLRGISDNRLSGCRG